MKQLKRWIFAFCVLMIMLPSAIHAEDVTSLAVILKTTGGVEMSAAGSDVWTVVHQGQVMASGDRLRTHAEGGVALLFVDDKSLLKLDSETEVTLMADAEGRKINKRIWMGAGNLWAKVTRKDDPHFEVETPTSVASVKGSEFYCSENPQGGNTLHAVTGRYSYRNEFGEIELGAKTTGQSDGKGAPRSRPTNPGELPGFGGIAGYGELEDDGRRVFRIGFMNESGEQKTLVIPLEQPE